MSKARRNGLIIGAILGIWVAWTNWNGSEARAAGSIMGGAAMGLVIGALVEKKPNRLK